MCIRDSHCLGRGGVPAWRVEVPHPVRHALSWADGFGQFQAGRAELQCGMIYSNDFGVSEFSHKKCLRFRIDWLSRSYRCGTALLWEKHTNFGGKRHWGEIEQELRKKIYCAYVLHVLLLWFHCFLSVSYTHLLAFIGIMNFFNTTATSVISRKKELALLEVVGMTKKQISKMLVAEEMCIRDRSCSSLYSLFRLTTAIGSMKSVEPVEDWSWIMPGTRDFASALTGRQ